MVWVYREELVNLGCVRQAQTRGENWAELEADPEWTLKDPAESCWVGLGTRLETGPLGGG